MRLILLCFSLSLAVSTGIAQKKILKQADRLEKAGLYQDASEKYMDALYKNSTSLPGREGLKRTGQKILDEMLADYFKARNTGELQKALRAFEDAQFYKERISYFKVELTIPSYHERDYQQDRESLLEGWYQEAQQASAEGRFDAAKKLYTQILTVDPDYKDALELRDATSTAPYFRKGVEAFESENYKLAWQQFKEIEPSDANYNTVKSYQQKIIEELRLTMSILPAQTNFHRSEWKLRSNIIAQVSQLKSPFIKLVDRENLDLIIEEQKLGLTGFVDEKTAARVGQIVGAQSVLVTKVVNYNYSKGELVETEKVAYTGSTGYTSSTSRFRPVKYREFSQASTMQVSVQYQLISSETSEVLAADVIHEELFDEMVYAEYHGDYNKLYPAKGELIYRTGKERQDFLALFDSKREVASKNDLDFRIQTQVASKMASSLNEFLMNRY